MLPTSLITKGSDPEPHTETHFVHMPPTLLGIPKYNQNGVPEIIKYKWERPPGPFPELVTYKRGPLTEIILKQT